MSTSSKDRKSRSRLIACSLLFLVSLSIFVYSEYLRDPHPVSHNQMLDTLIQKEILSMIADQEGYDSSQPHLVLLISSLSVNCPGFKAIREVGGENSKNSNIHVYLPNDFSKRDIEHLVQDFDFKVNLIIMSETLSKIYKKELVAGKLAPYLFLHINGEGSISSMKCSYCSDYIDYLKNSAGEIL